MSSPNQIQYDDNADYAASNNLSYNIGYEDYNSKVIEFPDHVYLGQLYGYKRYLMNHEKILNFKMPLYQFQLVPLKLDDFEDIKSDIIISYKAIQRLDEGCYLESLTKLCLNPIQLYEYFQYQNDSETFAATLYKNKRITNNEFQEIKRNLLNEMIKENLFLPGSKHTELANSLIAGGYWPDLGKRWGMGADKYLDSCLHYLMEEHKIYLEKSKSDKNFNKRLEGIVEDIERIKLVLKNKYWKV